MGPNAMETTPLRTRSIVCFALPLLWQPPHPFSRTVPLWDDGAVQRPTRHLFVCSNKRELGGRPACGAVGEKLVEAFTTRFAADRRLWGKLAVTSCGCLGPCFDGPNVVVYPDGTWYGGVTVEDVDEIVQSHLISGLIVDRLLYDFDEHKS